MDKRIVTHKWGNNPTNDEYTGSNGFIISNRYDKSIAHYLELVEIAKKDFPFLKDEDIECCEVRRSSYNQGCPFIKFSLPENTKKKGYEGYKNIDFDW